MRLMDNFDEEQRQAKFAKTEIHSVESVLNEARTSDVDVQQVMTMFELAKASYGMKDYQKAVEISLECKKLLYELMGDKT